MLHPQCRLARSGGDPGHPTDSGPASTAASPSPVTASSASRARRAAAGRWAGPFA